MNQRFHSFDWLRALAAMGVILAHIFSDTGMNNPTETQLVVYTFFLELLKPVIPVFLMLSGALVFKKCDNYKNAFKRCLRLINAFLLFAYPASILERVFTEGFSLSVFIYGLFDVLSGNTWDVFWYMYMLMGLYLVVPILKRGIDDRNTALWFSGILYFFLGIVPLINTISGKEVIVNVIPGLSQYLLYFVLGYVITIHVDNKTKNNLLVPSTIYAILYIALIILSILYNISIEKYANSVALMVPFVISVFIISWNCLNKPSKIISNISAYSFGIYLTHCYFINFMYKFMGIKLNNYPLAISVPIVFLIIFSLSWCTTHIALKIPFIKIHIIKTISGKLP